jgi:hypothetical protein
MVLRLQGDSPVRICDPCKKLEEAARFELRYGKNRPAKGGSKISNQDSASSSNIQHGNTHDYASEIVRSLSVDTSSTEVGSTTPEELRQQATEEKKNHKILKAQGKNQEALKAFKMAKELERQAAALELQIRKNRRQTSLASTSVRDDLNDPAESLKKIKKDDLGDELRELGWSDMDLHEDTDNKPANVSLEGELVNLLGENSKKPNKIDKSEVLAHKKRALTLKREGNLAEAKEELKKAKILEKKIEEQEFMIDDEDSDEELASLIRSLDVDKKDIMSVGKNLQDSSNFSFDQIDDDIVDGNFDVTDDDMYDPEMTAALESMGWIEDKSDEIVDKETILREIQSLKKEAVNKKRAGDTAEAMKLLKKARALEKEIGDDDVSPEITQKVAPKSKVALQKELLALKKRALGLRREGKFEEADEELRKGKVLEDQLEEIDMGSKEKVVLMIVDNHADNFDVGNDEEAEVTDQDLNDPAYTSLLNNLGWNDENDKIEVPKVQIRRSKGETQRELLGLKRKSLALRRQGEVEEAEKLLETAKDLETQLAEMEAPKQVDIAKETVKDLPKKEVEIVNEHLKIPTEISDTQMPDLDESSNSSQSSVKQEILGHKRKAISLKREGKLAEAKEELRQAKVLEKSLENQNSPEPKTEPKAESIAKTEPVVQKPKVSSRDRLKIQQESLSHKRSALKLRREGKMAEAEAEFELAKALESQLDEMNSQDPAKSEQTDDLGGVEDFLDPQLLSALKAVGIENSSGSSQGPVVKVEKPIEEKSQLEEEIKAAKVKAVNFKRSGKQAEALGALRQAKLLEKKLNSLTS